MTKEELCERISTNKNDDFLLDLSNFCRLYVNEVCNKVISKIDIIINSPFILYALHELRAREEVERKKFISDFGWRLKFALSRDAEDDVSYDLHNHAISHSKSYRDVLYDLLVKDGGDNVAKKIYSNKKGGARNESQQNSRN